MVHTSHCCWAQWMQPEERALVQSPSWFLTKENTVKYFNLEWAGRHLKCTGPAGQQHVSLRFSRSLVSTRAWTRKLPPNSRAWVLTLCDGCSHESKTWHWVWSRKVHFTPDNMSYLPKKQFVHIRILTTFQFSNFILLFQFKILFINFVMLKSSTIWLWAADLPEAWWQGTGDQVSDGISPLVVKLRLRVCRS